jgi:transcriptional regulator of acetoin/glycerol metabolism
MWEKKRPRYHDKDRDEHYSISNKLKSENKTTDEFEIMLCSLTLEDIIALRLELAAKSVHGKLYGFKLWHSVPDIAKEALLKYAYSAARTKNEAAAFLGIGKTDFRKLIKKFNIKSFFEKDGI